MNCCTSFKYLLALRYVASAVLGSRIAMTTILAVSVSSVTTANAADKYWSGNSSTTDNISDSANWFNGNPSSGDNLYFNNTQNRQWANINYGINSFFDTLKSFSGAGYNRITGDQTFLYVFENNSNGSLFEATATLANRTGPDSDLYINAYGSGGVAVSNVVMQNGKTLFFQGGNNILVNGGISQSGSGSASVVKNDSGTLTLSASSSYGGNTTINGGVVLAAHSSALGGSGSGTTVANGAALQLSNGITIDTETLGLSGSGSGSGGALRSVSGSNNYNGLITISANQTYLGAATNTILKVAAINAGENEFWVVGNGTTILGSGATNSGSGTAFVKTNTGIAVLAASNSWSGDEYIRQGVVVLSNNNALGVGGTTYLGARDGDTAAASTLQLGSGVINSNAISVEPNGGGVRTLSYQAGTGSATQLGSMILNTNSLAFNIASGGTLHFGGSLTANTNTSDLVRLAVDGGGTLIVTNSGTEISGNDRYQVRIGSGTLVIGAGTIISRTNVSDPGAGHAIDLGVSLTGAQVAQTASLYASNGITVSNSIYVGTTVGDAGRVVGVRGSGATGATFSGPIALADSILTLDTTDANLLVSGAITNFSGTGDVTKIGSSTLTLSGNNTFNGTLTVTDGKLTVATINNANANGTLGNSSHAVVLGSSGQEGFLHYTGATASSTKTFTAAASGTAGIEVSNAATTLTLSGAIGGSGAVTKGGAGTLLLSGNNTFSGALSIHAGTIEIASINNNGAAGVLGDNSHAVNLGKTNTSNTSTLLYTGGTASTTKGLTLVSQTNAAGVVNVSSAAAALTVSGAVTGGGRLEKAGAGTLILSASNNYAGGTTLAAGVLQLNSIHAAGTGKITQSSGSSTLLINTTGTVANEMDLFNIRTMQNVTLSGDKTLNNATYTVDEGVTTMESGNLSDEGGITKEGAGTLVVTGDNTFTGDVEVNEGVLELASVGGKAGGNTESVSVAQDAVLLISQSGQFNNAAAVSLSGGTIQRGSGVSEAFGDLTLEDDSFLNFGSTAEDKFLKFGSLTLDTYTLGVSNFLLGNKLQYQADDEAAGLALANTFSFTSSAARGFSFDSGTSTFTITAIPEPSTYAAAAGLLAMFLWPVRRRLVKDAKSILGLRPTGRERIEAYRKA
jgi:fibronectin-binding autotransporter adhesin